MDVASPCPSLLGLLGVKAGARNSNTVQYHFLHYSDFVKKFKVVTLNQFHLQLALNCSLHKHGKNPDPAVSVFYFAILFPIVFIPIRITFLFYRFFLEQI